MADVGKFRSPMTKATRALPDEGDGLGTILIYLYRAKSRLYTKWIKALICKTRGLKFLLQQAQFLDHST